MKTFEMKKIKTIFGLVAVVGLFVNILCLLGLAPASSFWMSSLMIMVSGTAAGLVSGRLIAFLMISGIVMFAISCVHWRWGWVAIDARFLCVPGVVAWLVGLVIAAGKEAMENKRSSRRTDASTS